MPTIDQNIEMLQRKREKYGGEAHTNQLVVMEEVRANAIANVPDEAGRQRTRIGLETYSPAAYSLWNTIIESLMEQLGANPIIVVDVLALLVRMAGEEGIKLAKDNLAKIHDYETELRAAKEERRLRKKARYSGQTVADA